MTVLAGGGGELVEHLATDLLVKGLIVVAAIVLVLIGMLVILRRLGR